MKKITEANIFRGLFCIYVLLIHCTGTPSRELDPMSASSIFFSVINIMSKGAVPAFIFISGLVISYGYKDKEMNLSNFYERRMKNTLSTYIIYTLIYYAVNIVVHNYEISFSYLIDRLLTGNMAYHLYFMIIIMQFYVIYPILWKLFKKYNNNILLLISGVIHIVCYIYIPMKYRFFGNYMVYFTLGCYVGFNYEFVKTILENKKVQIISLLTVVVATIYYIIELYLETHFQIKLNPTTSTWQIFSLITIPGYYIICMYIDKSKNTIVKKINKTLTDISVVSLEIYLIHPIIILLLQKLLSPLSIAWRYLLLTFIVLSLAYIYSNVYIKIKQNKNTKIKN